MRTDRHDTYFRSGEARVQQLMAHPTPDGLMAHASDAKDLKPSAERWFWRAHLLAALEAPWNDPLNDQTRSLVHSTTYWLRPSPSAILKGRTDDEDAQNLRERFNTAQRVAVARFLGFILAAPVLAGTGRAYRASQSIAWCWTDDPATTRAAEALRNEARTYRRPPADNSLYEDLSRVIEGAFEDTPAPVPPLMWQGLDDEASEYAIEFQGARWQTLAPWFLSFHSTAFSFMRPATFRYFLPAAMCAELGPGTDIELGFHLVDCVLGPSSIRDQIRARVLTFSRDERSAVADFLFADWAYGSQSPCPYERAIVDVWDPDTGLQPEDRAGSHD
ncbi:MAG: hypothetical protein ACI9MR_000520 [Myxococcota bacterium]|jgi:hypothetical protein